MGVITSVSMSGTSSGIARPCTLVKRSISGHPGKRAWIGDATLDRGGGRGRDAGEVRARTGPLAADEVAVTCRNASLSRGDDLVVYGEAHRASRLAPFEAGCGEDAVESECLGLAPHALRSRHHPRAHALRHVPAANDLRGPLQVRETAVGAGADEHVLDGQPEQLLAGAQAHVLERLAAGQASPRIPRLSGVGDLAIEGHRVRRASAPRDLR